MVRITIREMQEESLPAELLEPDTEPTIAEEKEEEEEEGKADEAEAEAEADELASEISGAVKLGRTLRAKYERKRSSLSV